MVQLPPGVWAYIVAGFASFWCLSVYATVVPLFMGTVLKFDIQTNGVMSAIPNLVQAFFLVCSSLASDYLLKRKILGTTSVRKIAVSTGLLGCAACMVAVTFTGCNRTLSVFFLSTALGMSGLNFASTTVVPLDMSPRFAGTISGIMNALGALSGALIPSLVGHLTRKRQTLDEWSIVFYASASICLFAVLVFVAFGSSEVQPWNSPPPTTADPPPSGSAEQSPSSPPGSDSSAPSSQWRFLSMPTKKSRQEENRPWRTASFPDLDDPPSPAVVLRFD